MRANLRENGPRILELVVASQEQRAVQLAESIT